MDQPQVDLADLFAFAQKALVAHKQEVNDLDGYNGNHGDNMVENVQMIVGELRPRRNGGSPMWDLEATRGRVPNRRPEDRREDGIPSVIWKGA